MSMNYFENHNKDYDYMQEELLKDIIADIGEVEYKLLRETMSDEEIIEFMGPESELES